MRRPTHIVLHDSGSSHGDRYLLERRYREQGFAAFPFHWVICNGWREKGVWVPALDGAVQQGIPVIADPIPSINICLIAKGEHLSAKQVLALHEQVKALMEMYRISITDVVGFYETARGRGSKAPGFNMATWRREFMKRAGA